MWRALRPCNTSVRIFPIRAPCRFPPRRSAPLPRPTGVGEPSHTAPAAGLGVDVALLSNVFLRTEWEWVQFAPLKGDHIHISTVRTALGLKF